MAISKDWKQRDKYTFTLLGNSRRVEVHQVENGGCWFFIGQDFDTGEFTNSINPLHVKPDSIQEKDMPLGLYSNLVSAQKYAELWMKLKTE